MSLWSTDPDKFAQTDRKMEEQERRREWQHLHGDGLLASACKTEPEKGLYIGLLQAEGR